MRKAALELEGQTFNRLLVTGRASKPSYWSCHCSCGKILEVRGTRLVGGTTGSCGCAKRKHGHSAGGKRSGTYLSWTAMKQRCKNKTDLAYGGGGIAFDPSWRDFANFLKDMGQRPDRMTLDRISPTQSYTKRNCRWATLKVQANNKRNTQRLHFNFEHYGREGSTAEWAAWLRTASGNVKWTVKHLQVVLKTLTLDQIVCAVHPQALTAPELLEREKRANLSVAQSDVREAIDRLLARSGQL